MTLVRPQQSERRIAEREAAAFTFSFTTARSPRQVGGWMVNLSSTGGVFIVSTSDAPRVGEHLHIQDVPSCALAVVARVALPALPRMAEVVRVDEAQGRTCRVAFQLCNIDEAPRD